MLVRSLSGSGGGVSGGHYYWNSSTSTPDGTASDSVHYSSYTAASSFGTGRWFPRSTQPQVGDYMQYTYTTPKVVHGISWQMGYGDYASSCQTLVWTVKGSTDGTNFFVLEDDIETGKNNNVGGTFAYVNVIIKPQELKAIRIECKTTSSSTYEVGIGNCKIYREK